MKKFFAIAAVAALSIFGVMDCRNSTVFNPAEDKLDLKELSYYGEYNTSNMKFKTNYVNGYVNSRGHYVNGYYRS